MQFKLKRGISLVLAFAMLCVPVFVNAETTHTDEWYADGRTSSSLVVTQTMAEKTRKCKAGTFNNVDGTTTEIAVDSSARKLSTNCSFGVKTKSAGTITAYIIARSSDASGEVTVEPAASATVKAGGGLVKAGKSGSPLIIEVTSAGLYTITNTTSKEADVVMVYFDENKNVTKNDVPFKISNATGKATTLTIDGNTIDVPANGVVEKTIPLANGVYSAMSSVVSLRTDATSFTISGAPTSPIELKMEEVTGKVIVTNDKGGFLSSGDSIKAQIESSTTVDGSIINIMPGTYNENFEITKPMTLKNADPASGEVIIYYNNGAYGGNMGGTVCVTASNVIMKDLVIMNNLNASYGTVKSVSTSGKQAAAIITNGDNFEAESCKFISVQDTVNSDQYSDGQSMLNQTFDNCVFYGTTDFLCGSCKMTYNNCEFRIFTGDLKDKNDAYIFAPNLMAEWVVNGGKIVKDEKCTVVNLWYARPWESKASTTQTLNIYGLKNEMANSMGTNGLMGFRGPTGGGATHSINEFNFNVYAGADSTTELLATSNVTKVDLFEMSQNPVVEFTDNKTARLLVADFGKNVGDTFIKNILPDITEMGFVLEDKATSALINDSNTIKVDTVYKQITTTTGEKYSLKADIPAQNGSYYGVGVLSGLSGTKTLRVVPYIKYDASFNSDKGLDEAPIYKFGAPVEITITVE